MTFQRLSPADIEERVRSFKSFAEKGLSLKQAAFEVGLGYVSSTKFCRANGIKFKRPESSDMRAPAMRKMRTEGKSLDEIGKIFDLSRERVRQVIAKAFGRCPNPQAEEKRVRRQEMAERRLNIQRSKTFVYLVESQNSLVKIGVSENPYARDGAINLVSPIPCRLVAFWPGSKGDEQGLHTRFEKFRVHNEWFVIKEELASYVESVRGRGVPTIKDWDHIVFPDRRATRTKAAEKRSVALKAKWANPEYRQEQLDTRKKYRQWDVERAAIRPDVSRIFSSPHTPTEAA